MDASELHARRLKAKEVLTPMKGDNFIFPVADGKVRIFGGDQRLRTSTLIRDRPEKGRGISSSSRKIRQALFSNSTSRCSTLDDAEARNDVWSIAGDFISRHHVEPRVKQYVPREESFLIPMKYIDVTRNTHTSLDVMMENEIGDHWNVDGERELSDAWTFFTRCILLNERPPDGFSCSGGRLTRKQTKSRPDNVWPDM